MSIEIDLEGELDEKRTPIFFYKYIDAKNPVINEEFIINFENITFVKPSGISILYNILKWLGDHNNEISFSLPSRADHKVLKTEVIKYLDDSMFFKLFLGEKIFEDSIIRNTTLPLMNLSISSTENWIKSKFNPWISKHLNCSIERLANLQILLQELFNNTRDHSTKDYCCTYSQFYPNKNEIEIGISDLGVGIPYNVKAKVPHLQYDWQCISQALNRGFTTLTNPHNMGEGLYILKRYITNDKIGYVSIISGNGHYKLFPSGNEYSNVLNYTYPGTYISIVININNISNILIDDYIDGGVDFEW